MKSTISDSSSKLLAIIICVVAIGCSNEAFDRQASPASMSPVQVVLRGTTIRRLPVGVDIIVSEPESYLQEFRAQTGARSVEAIPNTLRYCDVMIHFSRPEAYPHQQVGDTIYMFLLPRKEEAQKMIREHGLSGPSILEDAHGLQYARYGADPRHFVIFQTVVSAEYRCRDHPIVVSGEMGECTVCGQELQYKGETYEYFLPDQRNEGRTK